MDEQEMLHFVKALADADRLRMIGLLAQEPRRFSEISEQTGLHPADARRALDQLQHNGLVVLIDGVYHLDDKKPETLTRRQLEGERSSYAPEPDLEESRRRVLAAHFKPDGKLKQIPLQPAKRQIILDFLINAFTTGANYTEKEVNLILSRFHPDTAALRRYLVDAGMLARARDGSRYWRPE